MDEKKTQKGASIFINIMFIRVYCLFFLIGYESAVWICSVSNKIFIHWSGVSLEKKTTLRFFRTTVFKPYLYTKKEITFITIKKEIKWESFKIGKT